MAWIRKNVNPRGIITGDCVIRAIATATGYSWDKVFWDLAHEAFDRAEMPSWNGTWWAYLKSIGFRKHPISDKCPDCYTIEDFCIDHPKGTYILYIPNSSQGVGHVVAVRDGDYYDTWNSGNEVPLAYWRKE